VSVDEVINMAIAEQRVGGVGNSELVCAVCRNVIGNEVVDGTITEQRVGAVKNSEFVCPVCLSWFGQFKMALDCENLLQTFDSLRNTGNLAMAPTGDLEVSYVFEGHPGKLAEMIEKRSTPQELSPSRTTWRRIDSVSSSGVPFGKTMTQTTSSKIPTY
jgi:hypothetical protein